MFKVLFKSAIKNYKLVLLMKRLCLDLVSIFLSKHFLCVLFAVTCNAPVLEHYKYFPLYSHDS